MKTKVLALKRFALVGVALAGGAAILAGCGGQANRGGGSQASAASALLSSRDIAIAARADLASGVAVNGTLLPSVDVNIVAPYPEVLDKVLVKEGEAVRRGQVLARYRTASAEPAAAGAASRRAAAAADYERKKTLFDRGAVSARELEGSEAELRDAEAQAALASKVLADATVRAPVDGVIARRFVQSGDRPGDGDPLFRLVDTSELEFEALLPTAVLGSVEPGARVNLSISGAPGAPIEGRVARINPTVDPATRQGKVYVIVPNPDGGLAGGMFATGRIVLEEAAAVVVVPPSAVQGVLDRSPFAWVFAGGRLEKRPLGVGLRDEWTDRVEIRSGVAVGDTVVVTPIGGLSPGRRVEVTPEETATGLPVTS